MNITPEKTVVESLGPRGIKSPLQLARSRGDQSRYINSGLGGARTHNQRLKRALLSVCNIFVLSHL